MNTHKSFIFSGVLRAEQPLATCSKDLLDREGVKNKPVPVPSAQTAKGKRLMFPATGLRGKLRRAARDVVRAHVTQITGQEKPFSLDEHYLLTLGGIKGSGEQVRTSVAHEAEWRQKNPLISMFGAGDAGDLGFVQGHISVGNAICKSAFEPTIFAGARTDDLYRDKAQIAFLTDEDVASLVRQAVGGKDRSTLGAEIKALEASMKAARKAGNTEEVEAIQAKIAQAKEQQQAVKDATGTSDVSIGMPLAGFQAIPQGEEMEHSMFLMRSNEVELGLLLKALEQMAMNPFVGAHYATGCGMVSGSWEVFAAALDGKKSLGTVSFQPFGGLEVTGSALTDAVAAFEGFIQSKAWDFGIPKVR